MERPRYLYKYQTFTTTALENLKNRRIWFSAPARFNDPFDCGIATTDLTLNETDLLKLLDYLRSRVPDPAVVDKQCLTNGQPNDYLRESFASGAKSAFEDRRRIHREERGVACFSSERDDPLMWSHYADGHRGFCLEYDTSFDPFIGARAVVYRSEVPRVKALDVLVDSAEIDLFGPLLLTKHQCWSYEAEWRLVHVEANKSYVVDFRALTGVYFGAAMPFVQKEIISLILRDSPTQLYEMQPRDGQFTVHPVRVTYTPFQYG